MFPFHVGFALFLDAAGTDTYAQAPGADGTAWAQGTVGRGVDCRGTDCE